VVGGGRIDLGGRGAAAAGGSRRARLQPGRSDTNLPAAPHATGDGTPSEGDQPFIMNGPTAVGIGSTPRGAVKDGPPGRPTTRDGRVSVGNLL